jgi:hypothetical protein
MTLDADKNEIVGVFMYADQLELIIQALAYFGGNAYMSEDKLSDVDDLLVQLEEGQVETMTEGEIVAYYVENEDDDGIVH